MFYLLLELQFIPTQDPDLGAFNIALGDTSPGHVAAYIINLGLTFLGLIFMLLIIYGGITWMLARGNEEEVTKAKNIIKGAVIGLVIVLASLGITQLVFTQLTNITGAT